ncbi:uncharacterized protein H6S33_010531 [Morchella sextelata]|uniref:uncharacterized protein n=1 Tax=Morchella sextelata TaxID=1174677 RepID=UPI001D04D61D|nr:uncharacterized protein H6S33_010531 [Morchella sextelata]KAH0611266.1 hypothetical protein H6S33_010531 [Morchella sextelata]
MLPSAISYLSENVTVFSFDLIWSRRDFSASRVFQSPIGLQQKYLEVIMNVPLRGKLQPVERNNKFLINLKET